MGSRLKKQKQILSLLNAKGPSPQNGLQENESSGDDEKSQPQSSLLSQVYQFHRSIIQNINAGLIAISTNGEIIFANRKAASLFSAGINELMGINLKSLFVEEADAEKFLGFCSLPDKRIDDWESRMRDATEKEILVGINASTFEDVNNEFSGVVLLVRDLTDISQLRNQVEQMERLVLLGELAAGIAHEVRNPLAGIKAATQMLESPADDPNLRAELTRRIIREVDKANLLLQEFFKFARPAPPKPAFHDVEKIIDNVYLLLVSRIKRDNVTFDAEYRNQSVKVYVDDTQIEQVILNLLLNALDAIDDKGKLRISVREHKLSLITQSEQPSERRGELLYGVIEVEDNGRGILAKDIDKIFNPFFTTKDDGLGLGLSICSRLVRENGGKIDVRSVPGKSTTFTLALPTFAG